MPIRFVNNQILFNGSQIVVRDDEDPSCCCALPDYPCCSGGTPESLSVAITFTGPCAHHSGTYIVALQWSMGTSCFWQGTFADGVVTVSVGVSYVGGVRQIQVTFDVHLDDDPYWDTWSANWIHSESAGATYVCTDFDGFAVPFANCGYYPPFYPCSGSCAVTAL